MRVLLYPCPQTEKKSKKGKEKSKKKKEQQKEKEQTKKKKEEGKEKKTRGQTPKKKKEEAAEEGDEDEEEEDEEYDEIVLLGKKQARVASAKAEVASMTAAGTGMGRQVRSTLLERDDPMSPDSGKRRSRLGSGSESSSNGSSTSTSTSVSSSSSGDAEQDEPSKLAKTKSALCTVKSEEVVARPKKPHFYVETSGRPPRVLPTKYQGNRQEKHKSSDAHQRTIQILEEFLQDYDSNLGQLVHHYKECCKKKDHPAEGVYAVRVIRAVSRHVPGRPDVRRACSARFACCLQPCPWRLSNAPRVARVQQLTPFFVEGQDLAMAVALTSTAAPRTIQAVVRCGTKNCSSASQTHEDFKQQFPTTQPAKAAAWLLRAMARCTMGCD